MSYQGSELESLVPQCLLGNGGKGDTGCFLKLEDDGGSDLSIRVAALMGVRKGGEGRRGGREDGRK